MSNHPIIAIKGQPIIDETFTAGAATIKPGHLVMMSSATAVLVHGTAAANAAKTFALERGEMGKGVTDAYASGDRVKVGHFRPGDRVQARVAAAAPAIAAGDFLESNGTGCLRKAVTDASTDDTQRITVVARAREAIDNSAGGAEVFIDVEIL